jgi:hypothetical protein
MSSESPEETEVNVKDGAVVPSVEQMLAQGFDPIDLVPVEALGAGAETTLW